MTFISFKEKIHNLLSAIVESPSLHTRWLNTLSYLENCGARKIAACEHPTLVEEDMIKHAAEEFRHAHTLKRQISKLSQERMKSYELSSMLGGHTTLHYLTTLDVQVCRHLQEAGFCEASLTQAAYTLVTYAIELRAQELYPIYDTILRKAHSPVIIKAIILEEEEHLNEMKRSIEKLELGPVHAEKACLIESALCNEWLAAVEKNLRM